jgi:hypothetical protein
MAAVSPVQEQPGWKFWIIWMLASVGSLAAYMILFPALIDLIFQLASIDQPPNWMGMIINVTGSLAVGTVLGIAQWLVLRRVLKRTGWWVLATLLGYALLLVLPSLIPLVSFLPRTQEASILVSVVMFALTGLGLGLFQWLVLRWQVAQAGWWIGFSLGGWVLAYVLTGLVYYSGLNVEPFDLVATFIIPVAVAGVGLVWLLRRNTVNISIIESQDNSSK